jgi:hypothetical protein
VSPKARKGPPRIEEIWYQLDVVRWAVASTDAIQINLSVRFQTPVKGVQEGDLLIYSDDTHDNNSLSGSVSYNENHRLGAVCG